MLNMTCRLIQRGNSSAVEHRLAKARVAGSNPVSRSIISRTYKTLSPGSSIDCANCDRIGQKGWKIQECIEFL